LQAAPLLHCFSSAFTSSNCILHYLRPVCKMRLCCIASALHSLPPIAFFIASDLFARCASAASLQLCIHVLQLHSSLPQTCLQDAPLLHPFSSAFTSSNCILHCLRPVCKMRLCCIPSALLSRPPIAFFITSDLFARCASAASLQLCIHVLQLHSSLPQTCVQASTVHSRPPIAFFITSDLFARRASAALLQLCIHILRLQSSLPQTCLHDALLLHPFNSHDKARTAHTSHACCIRT